MRTITLFLFAALAVTSIDAASYQKIDGSIVDPIQHILGGDLAYSGANLEPQVDLTDAVLSLADLSFADLTGADLTGADLTGANLGGSDFSNILYYDDATWTDAYYWIPHEPTWHSGMDTAWRDSVGIVERSSLVSPEPSTLLLALFGLALLPRRRRR